MPIPGDAPARPAESGDTVIRAGRDGDADGLIALIGGCYAEYPGCVLDVDGEIPELRAIASHFAGRDGRFWVVETGGRVVGCVGAAPARSPATVELLKLYVDHTARDRGLGRRLVGLVEDEAARRRAAAVELWTDTRFHTAHRLYERLGYARQPATRALHDLSGSVEFHYRKRLGGG